MSDNIEIVDKEEMDNEIEKTEGQFNPKDYKVIIDLIKTMTEEYNTLVDTVTNTLHDDYGLNKLCVESILPYDNDQIKNMSIDDIKEFLVSNSIDRYNELTEDEDHYRKIMDIIKNSSVMINSSRMELKNLKEESQDILKEYFTFMSSDKVRQQRLKHIEDLKYALTIETNEAEKKRLTELINNLENVLNFSFLKERFDELGVKELESIKEGFFNGNKGAYVIKKYTDKITKFGYQVDIYKKFFNIEENFLDKKYSPFNNLFLYIAMRTIAYADPYTKKDKLIVSSLISALSNLIYHRFSETEDEGIFKGVITSILDLFMDDVEYFKENNTSYENHPVRIEGDAKREAERRESLTRILNNLKIEYDENASIEDLEKAMEKGREELVNKQLAEEKAAKREADMKKILNYKNWHLPKLNNQFVDVLAEPHIIDDEGNNVMSITEFHEKYDNGEFNELLDEINEKLGSQISYDENDILNITPKTDITE